MGSHESADHCDLREIAPQLSQSLLAWWQHHGRSGIPWKLLPGGLSPTPEQQLDPYGIWIAEVMLHSAAFHALSTFDFLIGRDLYSPWLSMGRFRAC